jgi:hypothetical protein
MSANRTVLNQNDMTTTAEFYQPLQVTTDPFYFHSWARILGRKERQGKKAQDRGWGATGEGIRNRKQHWIT